MRNDEIDPGAYQAARADEFAWRAARELGVSRRRFLTLAGLGGMGVAAVCSACTSSKPAAVKATPTTKTPPAEAALVKDLPPSEFRSMIGPGYHAETNWDQMARLGYVTPNRLFYISQSSKTPRLTPANWKLTVSGAGVIRPLEFTYDQLLALPAITSVVRSIESAGNGRAFFKEVLGRDTFLAGANGTNVPLPQWRLGGIGVAEWTGIPLGEILQRAGVKPSARDVVPAGLDDSKLRRPMSVAKAMQDDTLLAFAMNGDPLPPDHGYPVRALTPGWVGNHHVKWLGSIEVSEEPVFVPQNTTLDVYIGPDYKPQPPSLGPIADVQVMKSAFELGWPATLAARPQRIGGRSWGPEPIRAVEFSVDGGHTWAPATLHDPNIDRAWVRWSFEWAPTPGEYTVRARAIDARGNRQPETYPYNQHGLTYGAVVAHPVTVS